MNSDDVAALQDMPLHAMVSRLVRTNIESGRLPPGTALTEYGLAQELSLSRVPVGRALQRLEQEGLLARDGARGYVVGGAPRLSGRERQELEIPDDVLDLVRRRTEWRKIWDRVQGDLVACMPFGRFKIVEMTMAAHYGVSRTVTRDLLARLDTLGLVEHEGRSQCYLRRLTPGLMAELYQMRRLLEPAALMQAAPFHDKASLERMRADLLAAEARYPAISPDSFAKFEQDLHLELDRRLPKPNAGHADAADPDADPRHEPADPALSGHAQHRAVLRRTSAGVRAAARRRAGSGGARARGASEERRA